MSLKGAIVKLDLNFPKFWGRVTWSMRFWEGEGEGWHNGGGGKSKGMGWGQKEEEK